MRRTKKREADLGAAFIYNFTKYITWNESRGGDSFVIAIIGPSSVVSP